MRVIWTPGAKRDRRSIYKYIDADNPRAAIRMDKLFGEAAAKLADHPRLGKVGKVAGTRELIPHEHYRLVYSIDGETIWVLALMHTARRWPPVD